MGMMHLMGHTYGEQGLGATGAQTERAGANGGLQNRYQLEHRRVSHLARLLCAGTPMLNLTRDRAATAPGGQPFTSPDRALCIWQSRHPGEGRWMFPFQGTEAHVDPGREHLAKYRMGCRP